MTFAPDAPAAGDVELKTALSFKGGKISNVQILLVFAAPGTKQARAYTCFVFRHTKPDWCELVCISPISGALKIPTARVHLPPLKEGKAYPLRLLIRDRKLTCSFANRTVAVKCDPLPAGADLRYVGLTAGPVSEAVTLDDFKITCAARGAADKPKDAPTPAKPATKATAEQELQAAHLLKIGDAYRRTRLRKKAIEFYEKIVKEYPATAAAKEAKDWLTSLR